MSYDFEKYENVLEHMVRVIWRDPENLEIGVDISDLPEIKIIFDGYGYNDDTGEDDDTNSESYAIFIHKDSAMEDFVFPEHETTPWGLIHRPEEEVCIYAWYDVESDTWGFNSLEETSDHKMSNEEIMIILNKLYDKYYTEQ